MKPWHSIIKILGGRTARNVIFWIVWVWSFHNLNTTNSKQLGYNFDSPWYWYINISTLIIYFLVLYTNNLVLVPKYLVHKNWVKYFICLLPMCMLAGIVQSSIVRLGMSYIDVNDMQQLGGVSMQVDANWEIGNVFNQAIPYMIFGYLVWSFIFTMAWYMHDYSRQKRAAEEASKKQIEAELHFLKSQINPHFLFNTMNNLYGLSLRKAEETPETILKLSSILRYLLYESNTAFVSFEKEKDIMQAYIDLELLRIRDISGLRFTISSDRNYSIPPLLWLPILENLFKHGTRHITEQYYIDFSFTIEDHCLRISSKNNYKDIVRKEPGGIGLSNLRKRLELLYAGKYRITEEKTADTYTIKIEIALA